MRPLLETFGNYQLVSRLAVGGMAEVFLATVHGEAGFTKPVVIKRLHERYFDDEKLVQMFVDEARLTAQLMHGNICQVLDLGIVDCAFFMAMEYIAGEDVRTLQDYSNRQGLVLPVEAAVFITCEVLAGLDYAQRKRDSSGDTLGIIHRDVSPQNILISYEGEVKVIDFGIAKARTRAVQTEVGVIKGKFRYMSPEQASGQDLDHRSDLFSAAVVLYELLIGEPHSIDLPDTEILYRIRQAEFEPVRKKRKEVPAKLEKILKKALKRKREQRYDTAAEFRAELLDLAQKLKWRFGTVEMSQVMHGVFDEERRRKRDQSWTGEMVQVQPPSRTGSGSRRAAAGSQQVVVNLGDDDLEEVSLEEVLEEEPTVAFPAAAPTDEALDEEPTTAFGALVRPDEAAEEEPTEAYSTAAPRAAPAPRREARPRRSHRGGAFSRGDTLPALVKKPEIRSLAQAAAAPSTALTPIPERVATVERPEPGAAAASGSGARTALGVLVVLLLGGGLLFWLYTENPAFLGLGPPAKEFRRAPEPAPVPRRVEAPAAPDKKRRSVSGLVRIRSNPAGAKVHYCGKDTGKKTPAQLRIKKGAKACDIQLSLKGHEPYSMPAPDHSPRPMTLMATLRPLGRPTAPPPAAAPARPRRGKLRVTSIQPGTVVINGQQVGQTPRLELNLRPGTYHVTVEFPSLGRSSGRRTVKIQAGKTTTVHVDSE